MIHTLGRRNEQRRRRLRICLQIAFAAALTLASGHGMGAEKKMIVIAHRGASGYVAEHTAAAKTLAHGMHADFIEQDVVLTADEHPIVLHDIHLDTTTDVAAKFPDRVRNDNRFYAIDLNLAEIKQLRVTERIDTKTGKTVYPKRFPKTDTELRILTLGEEIRLIQGLNQSTGRDAGIYVEIKSPAWHREQNKDISRIVLETLTEHGYTERNDNVFLQCFDVAETKRLRQELGSKLKIIQLMGAPKANDETEWDAFRTLDGLKRLSKYAEGIGPSIDCLVTGKAADGAVIITDQVKHAHEAGMEVHPYTFRADSLPDYAANFDELLDIFVNQVQVDGLFTDFPDLAVKFRDKEGRAIK